MKLNDKNIRESFILRLSNTKHNIKIIEELSVANGSAIADIVSVSNSTHCYEIKGETDKIERVIKQSKYYDLAFNKITLITTHNHIEKAFSLSPSHWGIIEAIYSHKDNRIKFIYHRKSKNNIHMDKFTAIQTLWKREMLNASKKMGISFLKKEENRDFIAKKISVEYDKNSISKVISEQLKMR